ncbi:MAG: N-acetyltransferase [Bacteroidetes bacterium]|nr:MAG: N-acetyltransferase [Bacteroidota bacterium]
MKTICKPAKVWYLEMINLETSKIEEEKFQIKLQENINLEEYKLRYHKVGGKWNWANRLIMDDDKLRSLLNDPKNEIYYAYYNNSFVGYFELDCHQKDVELVYFGLLPEFMGKGLGKLLMQSVLQRANQHQTQRLWLHTCEFDSPQALNFYIKNGFIIYDEKIEDQLIITK